MTVYVESNFVLELAFDQEQKRSAEQILILAESGSIKLCFPAFSVCEPIWTLKGRAKDRAARISALRGDERHFGRSTALYGKADAAISQAITALSGAEQIEDIALRSFLLRVLKCAEILPVTDAVFSEAERLTLQMDLELPDAIVLASVLNHLRLSSNAASVFANRNSDDFDKALVKPELKKYSCDLINNFDDALNRLRADLGRP